MCVCDFCCFSFFLLGLSRSEQLNRDLSSRSSSPAEKDHSSPSAEPLSTPQTDTPRSSEPRLREAAVSAELSIFSAD